MPGSPMGEYPSIGNWGGLDNRCGPAPSSCEQACPQTPVKPAASTAAPRFT